MLRIAGIVVMVVGIALVFSARIYPAQRGRLEPWGASIFLAGLIVWAFGIRFI
ncbi:MAG: hypothetical protein KGJ66_02100 [Alphaproteobacteria bacterium]|nr:hypothetical protein [Alphaproteobacteria bacterium]